MIANPQLPKMTLEEYLEWESRQEIRHEYINGEVFAMTGGTIPHNDIVLNLYTALRPHLASRGCRANVSDVKVQISPQGPCFYPDLVVSCDERDRNARKFIQYPKLIVEVLSPTTENYDQRGKFAQYRRLASLEEYVLIASEQMSVECYRRFDEGLWLYQPYSCQSPISQEMIMFKSIEFACAIATIYENIQLDDQLR